MAAKQLHERFPRFFDAVFGLDEPCTAEKLPGGHQAPRLEHPLRLRQHGLRVRGMGEHRMAVDHVERGILVGKRGRVANPEFGVLVTSGRGGCPSHFDLRLLHVDAVQLAGGHRVREPDGNRSGAATEVEQAQSGLKMRQQVRGAYRGTSACEHLLELGTVTHGVGRGRCIVGCASVHRLNSCLLCENPVRRAGILTGGGAERQCSPYS